jgi:hypothetical protein
MLFCHLLPVIWRGHSVGVLVIVYFSLFILSLVIAYLTMHAMIHTKIHLFLTIVKYFHLNLHINHYQIILLNNFTYTYY